MNLAILETETQDFISRNKTTEITRLILKGSPFVNVTIQEIANQILAKQKSDKKLPTWFQTEKIYYPKAISIEQSSSEATAKYKSMLISGDSIIDITGGFGVDCYYFSNSFKNVIHCEINEELSKIVAYNFTQLLVKNIKPIAVNGVNYLKNSSEKYDCIYIDPSRRNEVKGKVFLLKDCVPEIPPKIDFLFTKTKTILIKTSPILDISQTIKELKNVKEVHVVAVKNEVKELLFLLEKNYLGVIKIKTANLKKEQTSTFEFEFESSQTSSFSFPQNYLYEPNAAILKSGGFNQITNSFEVHKLHQNSHLYTSDTLIDFPGRKFKILEQLPYDKKLIRKKLTEGKANITTRNFPKTVAQIRKETKIKDGGNMYLFFTTNQKNMLTVLICHKIE